MQQIRSTALSARLDPEEMRDVLRAYQNAVAGEILRFEGHVAKLMGDGVLAYFGWPRAHEDEAERAVRAGLAITAAVGTLSTPADEPLACRIGLATGVVVVRDLVGDGAAQEQAVVGETPNLAARLQEVAAPGQVVVAETTRRLLGGDFGVRDLGRQTLKGIAEPVQAYAIAGERSAESRFEARTGRSLLPMVGRDHERALLLERWEQAKAGEGQGVLVVGEAGIGKSRLAQALLEVLADEPHTRIRYQCSPYYRDSPLWPIVQQLARAADLRAEDATEEALDKLEQLIGAALDEARATVALLAPLLALDGERRYGALELTPQAQRARTLEALVARLTRLAGEQPLLVILEDAHWIDATTLELVELCLDRSTSVRALFLLTSRPDNQPALAAHPHVTRLTLNRLGRAGVAAIIHRLGGERLPPEVIDAIIARTDGVPLFVEEMTKAVLETGKAGLPASLHDALMARLDCLPDVKEVAQIAACIGREFDYRLLYTVCDRQQDELAGALDRLAAAELLFRRGTPPDAHYTFKHALVRDAAYGSLLKDRRHQIHARIVQALEEGFSGTPPEVVAYHATEAGLVEQAIDRWREAGEAALGKPAYAEAANHFARAIALLSGTADTAEGRERELALQVQRGQALIAARGYGADETLATFDRARHLAELIGQTPLRFPAMYGDWVGRYLRADFPRGLHRAQAFLKAAEQASERGACVIAHRALGISHMIMGALGEAHHHLQRSLELYDPAEHGSLAARFGHEPGIGARSYLAWTCWFQGYPRRAFALCAEADAIGRGLTHVNTLAYLHFHAGMVALFARELERLEVHAGKLDALALQHGLAQWKAYATFCAGWLSAGSGRHFEGIAAMTAGIAESRSAGSRIFAPMFLAELAKALILADRPGEAMAALDEARVKSRRPTSAVSSRKCTGFARNCCCARSQTPELPSAA